MRRVLLVTISAPAELRDHVVGKLNRCDGRVSAVIFLCPGDKPVAEIVALQRQLDVLHIDRAFHFGLLQADINGILRIGNGVGRSRVAGVVTAFGRLHGIKPQPAALLHHDRFDQLDVFSYAVLIGIHADDGRIGLHLLAHRHIRGTSAFTSEE